MSDPTLTINRMSDDHGEADWWVMYAENTILAAIAKAPDGPVTRLTEADYIPARYLATTGNIIAYTPTHGLYDRTTNGQPYIQWVKAERIKRL